ncbi:MAG: hypothetical protein ABSF49_16250 [Roseiarcus sp.]|uniref:hypothetical protein n=1 Tax=Roseiarcus sp. TaxID=1969460 RepID=UPI003C1DACE4
MPYKLIERKATDNGWRFCVRMLRERAELNPAAIATSNDFVLEDCYGKVVEYRVNGFHNRAEH